MQVQDKGETRVMALNKKPTIAIVSNYRDNSCGFAAYTRVREEGFANDFEVTVFDIQSAALLRPAEQTAAGDARIDEICEAIANFDFVSIDLEFGIWGNRLEKCQERILKCCAAARRLLLVVHRVDTDVAKSGAFAIAQAAIFQSLARRAADRPYYIVTHSKQEACTLRSVHGFMDVASHPLCFMPKARKEALRATSDASGWKQALGFEADAVVLGVFGAHSKYKDNLTVLRALSHLPARYKLVVAGGAHLFSIRPFEANENTTDILTAIDEIAQKQPGFEDRIRFLGVMDDPQFHQVMRDVDIVVAPYHDAGQMASGVGSMAFELGKRVVATYTRLFLSYRESYGDCFEVFDIGNYLELRDKVLRFDAVKARAMEERRDLYTPETMAALCRKLFETISAPGFANQTHAQKLEGLAASLRNPADAEGPTVEAVLSDLSHARRAYDEAVQVQEQLKVEKQHSEVALYHSEYQRNRAQEEMTLVRRNLAAVMALPSSFYRFLRRKTPVPRFNTILDDAARLHFEPAIRALWLMAPDVMMRKIPRANVQQGFMLAAVEALAEKRPNSRMLCVGSFEDTACMSLQALGYRVDAIDPVLNYDLRAYCDAHPDLKAQYDIVFSTSVIEHVEDDEGFVADIAKLLKPGGYAVLTCDYNDTWREGQPKPSTDYRLYRRTDMDRLLAAMPGVKLVDQPDWNRDAYDFTIWEHVEHRYTFATFVVQREAGAR